MKKLKTSRFTGPLPEPIKVLGKYFVSGGTSIIRAAFENSFFLDPDTVRGRTPLFPEFARASRKHYPGKKKGDFALWKRKRVKLDDNSRAQNAWARYSGSRIARKSGYGVRHIWGKPWDPAAFTAGWNLCYMPFWAGMLTEDQHPHADLQCAIKQAGYDLFFRHNPVCPRPSFVANPGLNLRRLLGTTPVRILSHPRASSRPQTSSSSASEQVILQIRGSKVSWSNLLKAVMLLRGLPHETFSTKNVRANSMSLVRRMLRETCWSPKQLQQFIDEHVRSV